MVTLACMGKSKKRSGDRHKPGYQVRIRSVYMKAVEDLKTRNGTSAPEEINRAVRELLVREGLWPPSESDDSD